MSVLLASACAAGAGRPASSPPRPSIPSGSATEANAEPVGKVRVRLVRVAELEQPLALAVREGDDALYVAQRTGEVIALRDGRAAKRAVLDLSGEVSAGSEQGLLGLAFSPDGRFLYVNYTDLDGDTHVTEFEMASERADPSSRREVLFVDQPY